MDSTVVGTLLESFKSPTFVLGALASATILYFVVAVFRKLIFHHLAKYPGPKLAGLSNICHSYWLLSGKQPYYFLELHRKYGPVVRNAPNELSFISPQAWRDIYEPRPGGRIHRKSGFYDNGSFADECASIVRERDPATHAQMRKYLNHGFSQKSLTEQEGLVAGCIDGAVRRIGQIGGAFGEQQGAGKTEAGFVNLTQWFNIMTFDIIGELAFGQSFDGIETAQTHVWVSRLLNALAKLGLLDTLKRFPSFGAAFTTCLPFLLSRALAEIRKNELMAIDLVNRRIHSPASSRHDFFTRMLESKDSAGISEVQMAAHATDFVVAGSETTATAMSAASHFLLRTERASSALMKEVRERFDRYEDINAKACSELPYLHAVGLEALRIFPPLPVATPRIVENPSGDYVDGCWVPPGTVVSINPTAASLSEQNFTDPFEFRPERWLGKNEKDVLDASQPFSLGPRGCLGRNLAWMELRTTLAKLWWLYDIDEITPSASTKAINTADEEWKICHGAPADADEPVNWLRDAKMETLWVKPAVNVKVHVREGATVPEGLGGVYVKDEGQDEKKFSEE